MAQRNPRRWSDEDLLLVVVALLCLSAGLLLIGEKSEAVPHGPVAPPEQPYQPTPRPREYRAPRRREEPAPRQEAPAPLPPRTTPAPGVWEDIRSRNVLIRCHKSYGDTQGSGVLIGNGLVLTDWHVVQNGRCWTDSQTVGSRLLFVVGFSDGYDLAVVEFSGYDPTSRLEFFYDPGHLRPGTPLITVGNPLGTTVEQSAIVVSGHPDWGSGVGPTEFWTRMDNWSGQGASGSLVYSLDGAPVGIVQQMDSRDGLRTNWMICRSMLPVVQLVNQVRRRY